MSICNFTLLQVSSQKLLKLSKPSAIYTTHFKMKTLLSAHKVYLFHVAVTVNDRLCGLVVRVLGYRSGGPGSIPGTTRKKSSASGTGSTQPREYNWGATWWKSSGSCIENREYGLGIHHADHVAPSIRKKFSIKSPTSGGRSVGIVRSRTQTMEFSFFFGCHSK
jgi:hypothetical protein